MSAIPDLQKNLNDRDGEVSGASDKGIETTPVRKFSTNIHFRSLAMLSLMLFGGARSFAFENAEHKYVSNLALTAAATDGPAPDIAKYQALTLSWTYGINYFNVFYGNPAEQLAHLRDQSLTIDYAGAIDGGDFTTITRSISDQYKAFNFSGTSPGNEGAYVWLGSAMHLIEDQASLPHATNIWHDLNDQFEGGDPQIVFGSRSSKFGGALTKDSAANVSSDQAYTQSLTATQNTIAQNLCPAGSSSTSAYLYNDQLSRGSSRYQGEPNSRPNLSATDYAEATSLSMRFATTRAGLAIMAAPLYRLGQSIRRLFVRIFIARQLWGCLTSKAVRQLISPISFS